MTQNQKLREALLSDMDIAVLRMPVGMAFAGDMAQFQYHNRVQALLNRIKALALPPDVPETNFWKLREALQAIANIDDATSHSADASVALDRIGQIARQALALPTAPVHPDAWGISRALVTLYAYECDGLTGEALAMPTADHLPDAGKMVVDHFPDAGKMIETAAPVGERLTLSAEDVHAAFVKHFPKTRISQAWIGFAAEIAEAVAARAALSSGDAVDAQRLDFIEKSARCDPKMDGQHVWWPTSLNKALKGPTLRAAIDAAMRKDKT